MEADDAVVLKVVSGETEAELVCGLLRSAGFECGYRDTVADDSLFEEFIASGPRDILVHGRDIEAARTFMSETERRAEAPPDLPPAPGA